jgi:hypothetical protein
MKALICGLLVAGTVAIGTGAEAKQKRMMTTTEIAANLCRQHQKGASIGKMSGYARASLNQGIDLERAMTGLSDVEKIKYQYEHDLAINQTAGTLVDAAIVNPKCQK